MTVGKTIQHNRQKLGLSQEELGQKLLVSGQIIDLWEKDQLLPNLPERIQLKEVLDLSVDEMLDLENKKSEEQKVPWEVNQFQFTKPEWHEISRLPRNSALKRPVVEVLLVVLILFLMVSSAPCLLISLFLGLLLLDSLLIVRGIRAYNKSWHQVPFPTLLLGIMLAQTVNDAVDRWGNPE